MRNLMCRAVMLSLLAVFSASACMAADSAVVVMYHRFGDDRVPSANTRLDQLDAHIVELKAGGYEVLPLPVIVEALLAGKPLPDKAVAITINDSGQTVWQHAWPRLQAQGLPFTLFVATDEADRGGDNLTWEQMRAMVASGLVTVGSQGASHGHLPLLSKQGVSDELTRSQARFESELGRAPTLFAWPYGEMSREAAEAVRESGFKAAFGQQSGVAWTKGDRWFLPRFALNQSYGEPERFRLAVRALPLPALDITPNDPKLTVNPPAFGFTLAEEVPGTEHLACYASHEGRAVLERLGPRIEVRLSQPFPQGRGRLNCTAPTLEGRWRWFGWQFFVP